MRRSFVAVLLLGLGTGIVTPGPAEAAPSRLQPCSEAWALVAGESSGLAQNDLSAWARVNDGFLSMSDATFDGPLSNAFGDVSAAAEVVTITLQSDTAEDPSHADFDASLGALGTVCAQLTVTQHKERVARFQRFSYQTGVVTGLAPAASSAATAAVASLVKPAVADGRKATGPACIGDAKRCGYFVETLKQRRCVPGLVCVNQQVGILAVGANSGMAWVNTLALDSRTGQPVPLSTIVPASATPAFLVRLNAEVKKVLAKGGIVNDPFFPTNLKLSDVQAWLPQPDGIHVWFAKYAVAPGSFGIVHVVVPAA